MPAVGSGPQSAEHAGPDPVIGVLALQGDFALHARALARAGARPREVRKPETLEEVAGLVIPGGESTTLLRLMDASGFGPAITRFHETGRPIFGTCAGLIVLAREVEAPRQASLGLIDITVERNAYGRQRESFAARGEVSLGGSTAGVEMVFIRAPRICRVGARVLALGRHGEEPVLVQEGGVLAATFHPELTEEPAIHHHFCRMVRRASMAVLSV